MPIYEFKCKNCGNVFEKLFLNGGVDNIKCPECGSSDCEKLMSSPAFMVDGRLTTTTCCGATEPCDKPCRRCK